MVDTEREHASDYIWKEHGFENRADPRVGVWMACRVTFLWHWLVGEILLLISIYTVYIYIMHFRWSCHIRTKTNHLTAIVHSSLASMKYEYEVWELAILNIQIT